MKAIVPLVTAFTDDTMSLSEVRIARLVGFYREREAAGFLVCSEAGEVFALSHAERKQVVEWAVREAKGLPVFVNVSASTTAAVLDLAQHAERHGAHAGVLTTPLLIGLTADEEASFLASVHRHANLICTVLNMPGGAPEGSDRAQRALQSSDDSALALTERSSSEEFTGSVGVCTSYGVMAPDKVARLSVGRREVLALAQAVFKTYRSHRIGKAWLTSQGVEIGPTRAPLRALCGQGKEALDKLTSVL